MSKNKIALKSESDIGYLKVSGKILSEILQELAKMLKPGISGDRLNTRAMELARNHKAYCSFKGFEKYPANICLSRNDEIVHGLPFGKIIQKGDIVGLDLGIKYKGYFTDSAATIIVGGADSSSPQDLVKKKKLVETTFACLKNTLQYCRSGYRLGDIGHAVQTLAENNGFSVVKRLVGHGVGYSVHEAPLVPNYGRRGEGIRLNPGMVLAIEPMVNIGTDEVIFDEKDNWTFLTADGSLSAHFEWTVAITKGEPIILTPLDWVEK